MRSSSKAGDSVRQEALSLFRVPQSMSARIRWCFLIFAAMDAAFIISLIIFKSSQVPAVRLAGCLTVVWLIWRWASEFLGRRSSVLGQLAEAAGLFLVAYSGGPPGTTAGLFYLSLFLRSSYASAPVVVLALASHLVAFFGAARFTEGPALDSATLMQLMGFPLWAGVVKVLATALTREEGTSRFQHVLATAGSSLVGATGRQEIVTTLERSMAQLLEGSSQVRSHKCFVADPSGNRAIQTRPNDNAWLALSELPDAVLTDLRQRTPLNLAPAEIGMGGTPATKDRVNIVALLVDQDVVGYIGVHSSKQLDREIRKAIDSLAVAGSLALQSVARTERFRAVVQNSSDAIGIFDPNSILVYVSPSVERVFGHTAEQIIGLTASAIIDLVHPQDQASLRTLIKDLLGTPGQVAGAQFRLKDPEGSWRHIESTITNLFEEPSVKGLVFNSRDVTERKKLENQLTHQAFHDPLTGLANRSLFEDRVSHALERGRRMSQSSAVLFIDLDNFKRINDSLGHGAGDRLLAVVAQRIKRTIRSADTAARFGGDEFAILLEDTDQQLASRASERILEAMSAPFDVGRGEIYVTTSIGLAVSSPDQSSADDLLMAADVAMYAAKARGKGRTEIFESQMKERVIDRLRLENDLRRALAMNEFVIHYHPIMSTLEGDVYGVEALIRWNHPERGLVPPDEFIPIAEETGIIVDIGRWVLEESCARLAEWQALRVRSEPLKLSVNISGRQLQSSTLLPDIDWILKQSGIAPSSLILEVTESMLVDEKAIAVLKAMKALGALVAVDDFGTGFSSLSYLARLPIDILKIDRSFAPGLVSHGEDAALAGGIIQLGESMGLRTVAEGIEEADQLARLVDLRCDLAQGFHFTKPLAADQLLEFLKAHSSVAGKSSEFGLV